MAFIYSAPDVFIQPRGSIEMPTTSGATIALTMSIVHLVRRLMQFDRATTYHNVLRIWPNRRDLCEGLQNDAGRHSSADRCQVSITTNHFTGRARSLAGNKRRSPRGRGTDHRKQATAPRVFGITQPSLGASLPHGCVSMLSRFSSIARRFPWAMVLARRAIPPP